MAATERITMTMRELDRLKMIQAVAETGLKPGRAAERLGLTTRQIRRLVARLREHGPAGRAIRLAFARPRGMQTGWSAVSASCGNKWSKVHSTPRARAGRKADAAANLHNRFKG